MPNSADLPGFWKYICRSHKSSEDLAAQPALSSTHISQTSYDVGQTMQGTTWKLPLLQKAKSTICESWPARALHGGLDPNSFATTFCSLINIGKDRLYFAIRNRFRLSYNLVSACWASVAFLRADGNAVLFQWTSTTAACEPRLEGTHVASLICNHFCSGLCVRASWSSSLICLCLTTDDIVQCHQFLQQYHTAVILQLQRLYMLDILLHSSELPILYMQLIPDTCSTSSPLSAIRRSKTQY